MPSGPHHRHVSPRVRPLEPAALAAARDWRAVEAAALTPVEVAHAALRDTLRDLCDAHQGAPPAAAVAPPDAAVVPEIELLEPDRWADEGGALGRLYAGDRRLSRAERELWSEHAFRRDLVHEAIGTYARALRRDRVGMLAVLAVVRATLLQDGARLRPTTFAALNQDAMRCCREAFYAH